MKAIDKRTKHHKARCKLCGRMRELKTPHLCVPMMGNQYRPRAWVIPPSGIKRRILVKPTPPRPPAKTPKEPPC